MQKMMFRRKLKLLQPLLLYAFKPIKTLEYSKDMVVGIFLPEISSGMPDGECFQTIAHYISYRRVFQAIRSPELVRIQQF